MAATLFPSIRESPNKMRKWDARVRLRGSRASRVAAALAGLRVLRLPRRTLSRGRGGPTPNRARARAQCWPPHQQALAGSHSEAGSLRLAAATHWQAVDWPRASGFNAAGLPGRPRP